jgi:cytochrome b561
MGSVAQDKAPGWPLLVRLLHWLSAGLVLLAAGLGLIMIHGSMAVGPRFEMFQTHKSFGICVLALALVRLATRALTRRPPERGSALERRLAGLVHAVFYALLIGLPLLGWLSASAASLSVPTRVFGLIRLPRLVAADPAIEALARMAHQWLAYALLALVALHAAAAFKHQLVDRDGLLWRMIRG